MGKETKKMPYHLIVTDNETGETIRDLDFDALVGAARTSEEMSAGLVISRCNRLAMAETVSAAEIVVAETLKEDPLLRMAKSMFEAEVIGKETEEPENNQ